MNTVFAMLAGACFSAMFVSRPGVVFYTIAALAVLFIRLTKGGF